MSKLFKTKATLQRVMSIHWKIYHYLQPNFVKIEMLLDICFICIFLTNWFDSILLRSKDLEEIPDLKTNNTHSITGLESRVLKMMVKSGLEFFILKFTEPLQRYLLTCPANSAFLGRFFCTGQQQL